jgi:DNA-binding NarL/FixJ family response regulator
MTVLPDAAAVLAGILANIEARRYEPLTRREEDVMALILAGVRDNGIAAALGIGVKTVRTHTENVLQKYQVHSRVGAAVVFAMQILRACCCPGQCPRLWLQLQKASAAAGACSASGKRGAQAELASILRSLEREGCKALTRAEESAMALAINDLGDKRIADLLHTSVPTLRRLLRAARRKLRQPNRTQAAVAFAARTVLACSRPGHCGRLACQLLS